MMTYLCEFLKDEFDLVISFCGSTACSPDLKTIFTTVFDDRFMFDRFSVDFLRTLLEQQEKIKLEGKKRRVLLLFDDVETDPDEANYLGFLSTRHRHYDISLMYCAVRYSAVHKTYRASSDILFLFNVPMYSDRKMLLLEHSINTGLASFAMKNMKQFECLVMESGHTQKLKVFRAPSYLTNNDQEDPCHDRKTENEKSHTKGTEEGGKVQNSKAELFDQTETPQLSPLESSTPELEMSDPSNIG